MREAKPVEFSNRIQVSDVSAGPIRFTSLDYIITLARLTQLFFNLLGVIFELWGLASAVISSGLLRKTSKCSLISAVQNGSFVSVCYSTCCGKLFPIIFKKITPCTFSYRVSKRPLSSTVRCCLHPCARELAVVFLSLFSPYACRTRMAILALFWPDCFRPT